MDLPRGDYELEVSFVGTGDTTLLKAAPLRVPVGRNDM